MKVLGGGGVGEETLLQKGPSPTKHFRIKPFKKAHKKTSAAFVRNAAPYFFVRQRNFAVRYMPR